MEDYYTANVQARPQVTGMNAAVHDHTLSNASFAIPPATTQLPFRSGSFSQLQHHVERPNVAPLQHYQRPSHSSEGTSGDLSPTFDTSRSGSHEEEPDQAKLNTNSFDPHLTKHRRRTLPHQLSVLDAQFRECSKPDMSLRKQLAEQLGMSVREVQVWFQNRRAKQKKINAKAGQDSSSTDSVASQAFNAPLATYPDFIESSGDGQPWTDQLRPSTHSPTSIDAMRGQLPILRNPFGLLPPHSQPPPLAIEPSNASPPDLDEYTLSAEDFAIAGAEAHWAPPRSYVDPRPPVHSTPSSPEDLLQGGHAIRSISDIYVPPITYAYSDADSAPYTPITPLTYSGPFPGVEQGDYSPPITATDGLSTSFSQQQQSSHTAASTLGRRQSCPVGFVDSFKGLQPYFASPPYSATSGSFQEQQQQFSYHHGLHHSSQPGSPVILPQGATYDLRPGQQVQGRQHHPTASSNAIPHRPRLSAMPQIGQQLSWSGPTQHESFGDLQPPLAIPDQFSSNAMYHSSAIASMPSAWRQQVASEAYNRRPSVSSSSWLLDPIAEQPPAAIALNRLETGDLANSPMNLPLSAHNTPGSIGGSNPHARRGSVPRKMKSQSNLFSPYYVPGREASAGSLLNYEGF